MNNLTFDAPWFLLLLLLLPVIWILSYRSLAGLGSVRRIFALGLRTFVFTLLVLCLARTQWQQRTDRLTVIYVLDQSESIPKTKRDYMLKFVSRAVQEHRRSEKHDKAGVVIFGGNAKIEAAPFDGDLPIINKFEAGFDLDTSTTSLESALKLAKATFPEDSAKRIVVVSDGNENLGDSIGLAQSMAREGIGIDVVPVQLEVDSDISVDKVVIPSDVRKGADFETRVVLTNDAVATEANPDGKVQGKLKLVENASGEDRVVRTLDVTLDPGKNVIGIKHQVDKAAVFTFAATFTPDDPSVDAIVQNNSASAFTHVRGKGKVLLIEDFASTGEFAVLVEMLRKNSIEVQTMTNAELFSTPAQLLEFDSVILGNVARSTGDGNTAYSFSDAQIEMLVRNCEDLGCGLVMLGGDRSFGAGGWSNTKLESAMPVDFQIKNDKVRAVGCLIMMMHASEIAQSNFWQKKICQEAIKVLGPMDYCGVVTWPNAGSGRWLWKLPTGVDRVFGNRKKMMGMVGRMTVGDMPDFNGPMQLALKGFKTAGGAGGKPSMKHMIIISDGDPIPPRGTLLNGFVKEKIVISTVACGVHAQAMNNPLRKIATQTGGKFYFVKDAKALPKIFQLEARRVAKPVIKESKVGMKLRITPSGKQHEILKGVVLDSLPGFTGYVLTTVKTNPLVEQLLLSNDPNDEGENSTLLATWRFGVGRATVFTSDVGHKWTTDWLEDGNFEKLLVQAIRHSMRPVTENANFTVATEVRDNRARIVVTALDENEDFLNYLNMTASGVAPDLKSFDMEFNQVGPGRYVAEKSVESSGNYLFSITPGEGYERLTAGVNVPYSTEYTDRNSNLALLQNLANFEPEGGQSGKLIDGQLSDSGLQDLLSVNTFRPTLTHATGIQDVWPWLLVLCGSVFLMDVFVRRVAVDLTPVWKWMAKVRSRLKGEEQTERKASIARLQSRKAEIEHSIETRRSTTRFEPEIDESKMSGQARLDAVIGEEIDKTPRRPDKIVRDDKTDEEETSYTSRLLDAKRKAQKDRDSD